MTCTHEWKDSTTPAGPEWYCGKCKALYSEVKNQPKSTKREWVGLTNDEKETLSYQAEGNTWTAVELAEAKLKEKNT
jgi:hypothetical protein